jgi:aspartate carbamoyltransferase catalytic subunit
MQTAEYKNKDVPQLSFRHLLDAHDVKPDDLTQILALAGRYHREAKSGVRRWHDGQDYILATLFFEPSTRTRFSFESAMLRLGGQIITLEQGMSSSLKKGESLADTARMVSGYADLIVIRHDEVGSAAAFAGLASVPVINGGDGANQHPTQALADLYTIQLEKSRLDNLTIGIVGDLKYSRTAHSLLNLMSLYPHNSFVLISHPSLRLEPAQKQELEKSGCKVRETDDLAGVIRDLDVLYVTRVQGERFPNRGDYEAVKDEFCIRAETIAAARPDLVLMHALPRVNEIHPDVDNLPQAKYFEQAGRAVFVRMALLSLMKESGPIAAA